VENNRYISTAAPGGFVNAIAEDVNANLWIANQNLGLIRLSPGNEVQQVRWDTFGSHGPGLTLASTPSQGGVWIGFLDGGIAWFREGKPQASYSTANGLGQGHVSDLRFDKQGVLWAATEGGLSLVKNGRVSTIAKESGLPCDSVHWTLPDNSESVWLMMSCGLVRANLADLESWSPGRRIQTTLFDGSDGLGVRAIEGGLNPHVAKSLDGRLWFWNVDALGMIDPRHIPVNKLPPPVHIEQITADRKPISDRRLPPLTRDLQIDYTALSFVAPERNQFKYKLEGFDRDWIEAGNRRQAFYTNLPPRDYRFRVIASNNSGVWNEAGASLDFSVDPAYYQTTWFRLSCVAAFLALLWVLYVLRVRYLARQFTLRLEGRVSERTRIARELHDTLLQSFQGVLLKFHAMSFKPPENSETRRELDRVIEQAREAIAEGRDAVQGLRYSTRISNDLARSIGAVGEGLAGEKTDEHTPQFQVQVEGASRDLPPIVRDEVYRVACEALRNAFRHAHAKRIEVEIHYDRRELRVRIRDNGKGIDSKVLEAGGRAGHHGMPGMHERARMAGGKLAVWSKPDSGTEIELTIPARVAYDKSLGMKHSMASGEGAG
jgi:signal transduction histidine kinase